MACILLVEDDDDVRLVIHEALHQAGHIVSVAVDVAQARAALATLACDLLVSDIILRGGDGFQLAALAAERGIRTLFVTGAPVHVDRLSAMGAPHLAKPFRLRDVVAAVANLLA